MAAATFVGTDAATQGNWKTNYGTDGYNVFEDNAGSNPSYPGYATVTPAGHGGFTWDAAPVAAKALQRATAGRIAATWYAATSWTLTVTIASGTKRVSIYFYDNDGGRVVDVAVKDGGTTLDSRTVSSFDNGKWLTWDVSGTVTFQFTKAGLHNATVSGVFFDPAPSGGRTGTLGSTLGALTCAASMTVGVSSTTPRLADAIRIEEDYGTGWVSNPDVIADTIKWHRGIDGSGPLDRTAQPGFLRYDVRNDAGCSGGVMGYYSPGNPNCRTGFGDGIPARLVIRVQGVDRVRWTGRIANIKVEAGRRGSRRSSVYCTDWLEEASTTDVRGLSLLTNVTGNTAMTALVAAVPLAPASTSFDTGVSTFPYVFDQVGDKAKVLQEIARVTRSEMGQAYLTAGGVLKWENRDNRTLRTSQVAFVNTMAGLDAQRERRAQLNLVKVTVHPRRYTGTTEVLYSHDGIPSIDAGGTLTLDAAYRDPSQEALRVGGRNMQTFTATTDYLANTAENGSGTNVTASMVTTGTFFGANAARFVVHNPTGGRIYLTKLQCRGAALKDYAPITVLSQDLVSQNARGVNDIEIDLPFESSAETGQGLADQIQTVYGAQVLLVTKMTLEANRNLTLMLQAVTREISDRITVSEDVTGVSRDYFINGEDGECTGPRSFRVSWTLAPADASSYFIWDVSLWDGASSLWGFA